MRFKINYIKLRIVLLFIILSLIGYQYLRQHERGYPGARYIPPQGIAEEIDTHGKVPGNPDKEIKDAKRLFRLIQAYRKNHDGMYPQKTGDLYLDIYKHPEYYGIGVGLNGMARWWKIVDFIHSFNSPDFKYADSPALRNLPKSSGSIPFIISDKRPDGNAVGGPKPPGARDVLAYSDLYVHQNVRYYKGDRTTSNPVGFYIVLWDDGTVTKVPYNNILYVPQRYGDFGCAFPGQAGVPSDAMTYKEFEEKVANNPQKWRASENTRTKK